MVILQSEFFKISLSRKHLDSYLLFCINLFACYDMLFLSKYMKKIWLYNVYIVKRGESIFIIFSDNHAYLFLILHQNLTNGSFPKVNCSVKFETVTN